MGCRGEHVGGDLAAGDLAIDELWPVNHRALLYVPIKRGPLTHGPPLLASLGCIDRVHVATAPGVKLIFPLFIFQIL